MEEVLTSKALGFLAPVKHWGRRGSIFDLPSVRFYPGNPEHLNLEG